jgi:hypothetical protein
MQQRQTRTMRLLPVASVSVFLSVALPLVADAPSDYKGVPETGTALAVPGKIPAVGYDGAPGDAPDIAFHKNGKLSKSNVRKSTDSVGIAQFNKGHVTTKGEAEAPDQVYVGWTQPGEWLKYTLDVKEAGTYVIGAKVAAGSTGATLRFTFTSGADSGEVEIPTTAGFQPGVEVYHVWETLDHLAEVTLPAGPCVMTVAIGKTAGLNLETFTLTKK